MAESMMFDYSKDREFVIKHLPERDRWEQLAEEAAELSKAALKMIRADGLSANKTPINPVDALLNVVEELQDVFMCAEAVEISMHDTRSNPKWQRWAERIKAGGIDVGTSTDGD